jgi:hypothetical protein
MIITWSLNPCKISRREPLKAPKISHKDWSEVGEHRIQRVRCQRLRISQVPSITQTIRPSIIGKGENLTITRKNNMSIPQNLLRDTIQVQNLNSHGEVMPLPH